MLNYDFRKQRKSRKKTKKYHPECLKISEIRKLEKKKHLKHFFPIMLYFLSACYIIHNSLSFCVQ